MQIELYDVSYPERRTLTREQVIIAASDSYYNHADSYGPEPECEPVYKDPTAHKPETLADCMQWLEHYGDYTFTSSAHRQAELDGSAVVYPPETLRDVLAEALAGTDNAHERAEDWYNSTPKADLIKFADEMSLDIGQTRDQLDDDWNARVIEKKAEQIRLIDEITA